MSLLFPWNVLNFVTRTGTGAVRSYGVTITPVVTHKYTVFYRLTAFNACPCRTGTFPSSSRHSTDPRLSSSLRQMSFKRCDSRLLAVKHSGPHRVRTIRNYGELRAEFGDVLLKQVHPPTAGTRGNRHIQSITLVGRDSKSVA